MSQNEHSPSSSPMSQYPEAVGHLMVLNASGRPTKKKVALYPTKARRSLTIGTCSKQCQIILKKDSRNYNEGTPIFKPKHACVFIHPMLQYKVMIKKLDNDGKVFVDAKELKGDEGLEFELKDNCTITIGSKEGGKSFRFEYADSCKAMNPSSLSSKENLLPTSSSKAQPTSLSSRQITSKISRENFGGDNNNTQSENSLKRQRMGSPFAENTPKKSRNQEHSVGHSESKYQVTPSPLPSTVNTIHNSSGSTKSSSNNDPNNSRLSISIISPQLIHPKQTTGNERTEKGVIHEQNQSEKNDQNLSFAHDLLEYREDNDDDNASTQISQYPHHSSYRDILYTQSGHSSHNISSNSLEMSNQDKFKKPSEVTGKLKTSIIPMYGNIDDDDDKDEDLIKLNKQLEIQVTSQQKQIDILKRRLSIVENDATHIREELYQQQQQYEDEKELWEKERSELLKMKRQFSETANSMSEILSNVNQDFLSLITQKKSQEDEQEMRLHELHSFMVNSLQNMISDASRIKIQPDHRKLSLLKDEITNLKSKLRSDNQCKFNMH